MKDDLQYLTNDSRTARAPESLIVFGRLIAIQPIAQTARRFIVNRRQMIAKIPLVSFGAVAFGLLSSCGGGGGSSSDSPPVTTNMASCSANGATSDMRFNDGHSHPANMVTAVDIAAATQKTYTSPMDDTGHVHTFTLMAAHFTDLQRGVVVNLITDADTTGHTHPVVVTCNS